MSVTIVVRKRHMLAGLSLLVVTTLVGVALLVPAVSDATTYLTRSASCAGVNFYPDTSDDSYITSSTDRYNNGAGTETFRCNAALPTGAIVTKVQFSVSGPASCFLTRTELADPFGFTHMATVTNSLNANLRLTTTTISNAKIDNASYAYSLDCSLTDGFYGADVIYKITAAKG